MGAFFVSSFLGICMERVFYNKSGTLTVYAFACGYIEQRKERNKIVSLFKEGCWHVQARDDDRGRYVWECFDTLTKARKFFDKKSNFK